MTRGQPREVHTSRPAGREGASWSSPRSTATVEHRPARRRLWSMLEALIHPQETPPTLEVHSVDSALERAFRSFETPASLDRAARDRERWDELGDLARPQRPAPQIEAFHVDSPLERAFARWAEDPPAARAAGDARATPTPRTAAATTSPHAVEFDPGFAPAVASGFLTPEQAKTRGDRRQLAARLAGRHGLSLANAQALADDRITLLQALEREAAMKATAAAPEPIRPPTSRPVTRSRTALISLGAVVIAGLLLFGPRWRTRAVKPPVATGETVALPTDVVDMHVGDGVMVTRSADSAAIVRISGPTPDNVLLAYCELASGKALLRPEGIGPTMPPRSGARLGLFADPVLEDRARAIVIERDAVARQWIAGDGRSIISAEDAPDYPEEVRIAGVRPVKQRR
ncbi:MAG: hypothetical protein JSV80_17720 [Acidobacteriota bacterium]|nr:MAG: hypothetical protein JSV80_17720 [Acidobacteriota bacterium]